MAAGAGRLCSLVVLVMALLAMFTADAARPHHTMHSLNKELSSAFGVSGGASEPCCLCVCTLIWPPELSTCVCGGEWEGSCPSVCKDCSCDDNNKCICHDGLTVKYNDCAANKCPWSANHKEMM